MERWGSDAAMRLVVETDGEKRVGNPYRIHERDINGRFAPFGKPV